MSFLSLAVYDSPYYILGNIEDLSKSDEKFVISTLTGTYIDYYYIYSISDYSSKIYTMYEHYLYKWMNTNYHIHDIKYDFTSYSSQTSEQSNTHWTIYTYETPYTILKLCIEYLSKNRQILHVCSTILLKTPNNIVAEEEKTNLVKYLEEIRQKAVESNIYIVDEYYEERALECAIEYARDQCR